MVCRGGHQEELDNRNSEVKKIVEKLNWVFLTKQTESRGEEKLIITHNQQL